MKKLGAMLVAGILCLGMTMTAFATGSISTDVTATAQDKDGNAVEVKVYDVAESAEEYQAVEAAADTLVPDGKKVAAIPTVVNIDANGAKNVTVEIQVGGDDFEVGDDVMVLHWDNGAWNLVTTTKVEAGNKVVATFDSLSPVAIVKLAAKDAVDPTNPANPTEPAKPTNPTDNNKPADNKNDGKSPATGEAGMAGLFTVVALCGAALVLVNRKKVA